MTEAPEFRSGDMVRWQVAPDLKGRIVHIDDEETTEGGESTGFTITAGFVGGSP